MASYTDVLIIRDDLDDSCIQKSNTVVYGIPEGTQRIYKN